MWGKIKTESDLVTDREGCINKQWDMQYIKKIEINLTTAYYIWLSLTIIIIFSELSDF